MISVIVSSVFDIEYKLAKKQKHISKNTIERARNESNSGQISLSASH